jgi:membrane-bound lytic murein transglycosylase
MKHQAGTLLSYTAVLMLAGTMLVVNPVLAATATSRSPDAQHMRETVTAKAKEEARQKSQNFNADAVSAIEQVEQAGSLLKSGKYEDALTALKSADKKLEVAIAADPSLKLIPVVQDVSTYDLMTSPKAVKDEVSSICEVN